MIEFRFSEFDRLAAAFAALSEMDIHYHPEIQKRFAAEGVKHTGGGEYTLEGHDMDKDLTPGEVSLLETKGGKVLAGFIQDLADGKIRA